MSDLRELLKEEYRKKGMTITPQSLMEMIEEVMDGWSLITEEDTSPQTLTIDLIPIQPISEIGWGSLVTPDKGGPDVRTPAGQSLAQYLSNIAPGEDIQGKIVALNEYFANPLPEEGETPAQQLKNTISNLVFYKTLTNIITNFNASAAGFAFESFLAVLLDAESGKQIPASEGSTIADIVLFQGGRPISLKLYREGQLKVGGSYKQLVEDLTGKYPVMEYIVVTKDLKGSGLKQQGKLNFYGFNFTRENFLEVLALKPKEVALLSIPDVFWSPIPDLEKMIAEGAQLKDLLRIPGRTEVNLKPVADGFMQDVKTAMASAGFEDEIIQQFETEFSNVIDVDTGLYKDNNKPFSLISGVPKTAADARFPKRRGQALRNQITLTPEQNDALLQIMNAAHYGAVKKRRKLGKGGSARKEKFKELNYRAPRKSLKRLLEIQQQGSPELFAAALKSTDGYVRNRQFELAKGDLGKLKSISNQENLFPYDKFEVGTIEVGAAKIQDMLDRSVNAFNKSIFSIFSDLKDLSTNFNAYVAGGLKDDALAEEAQGDAENIATGTEKIRDPDSKE